MTVFTAVPWTIHVRCIRPVGMCVESPAISWAINNLFGVAGSQPKIELG